MPVCRFYLENRCRYGENCKFEHPRGGGGGGAQRSLFGSNDNWQGGGGGGQQRVTFRDSFGGGGQGNNNQYKWVSNQQQQPGQGALSQPGSALDLVNNLPKELETWEKSKMWPFSCLTLEKDLPCLPEFHDISMEEMRMDAYDAMKTGNLQPYTQKYQTLMNEFQNKRALLKNMTMDLKQKLISIVEEGRKKKAQQSTPAQSSFGANPSQNLFGQSENTGGSSIFGGSASSSSSPFGKPAAPSAFGGNSSSGGGLFSSGTSGSAFGSPPSSTLFGKPAQGGSVFGGQSPNPSQPTTNLFGMGSQNSSSAAPGLFGSQTPGQAGGSLFGGNAQTSQTSSLFGAAPSSTPSQGLFGKPSPGLGQAQGTPSLFGTGTSSAQSTSVFGGPPSYSSSLFGSSPSQGQQPATLFGKPVADSQGPSQSLGGMGTPGSSQVDGGLFGKGAAPAGSGFTSQSPFGGNVSTPAATSSGSAPNSGIFTPLAELTEQEKAAFEAKTFELGKIPLRPPPKELTS